MTNTEFPPELLPETQVLVGARIASKTAMLASLAKHAALASGLPPEVLASALAAREALGSTGFGNGIAVPHARLEGLHAALCVLMVLAKPVAYNAVDGKPVDIAFLLLSPLADNATHLATLAAATRRLRRPACVAALRASAAPTAARYAFLSA